MAGEKEIAYARPVAAAAKQGRPACELRRRARLSYAIDLDEIAAGDVMRMLRRLGHAQYRREAGVAAFHERTAFRPAHGHDLSGDCGAQAGPLLAIVLALRQLGRHEPAPDSSAKNCGSMRPAATCSPTPGLIDVIEGRAGIEVVLAAPVAPAARRPIAIDRGHQRGRAIDHGGIDDLTPTGASASRSAQMRPKAR